MQVAKPETVKRFVRGTPEDVNGSRLRLVLHLNLTVNLNPFIYISYKSNVSDYFNSVCKYSGVANHLQLYISPQHEKKCWGFRVQLVWTG